MADLDAMTVVVAELDLSAAGYLEKLPAVCWHDQYSYTLIILYKNN